MANLLQEPSNTPLTGEYIPKALPFQHKMFCKKYIELACNGTQAYIDIFSESYREKNNKKITAEIAGSLASRMLQKVEIIRHLDRLQAEQSAAADISINNVLMKYKRWSEFDPLDIFEVRKVERFQRDGSSYDPPRYDMALYSKNLEDIPREVRQCIQSIKQGRDGFEIKIVDKLAANHALAKFLGLDKKIIEQSGNVTLNFDKDDEAL